MQWRTQFAFVCTFDTKSTKSGADCDAAPHAKMYASRYLPYHAAQGGTGGSTTALLKKQADL